MKDKLTKVSLITPVFNEEDCIKKFHTSISNYFELNRDIELEIIFIDDGSTDNTCKIIKEISKNDPRIETISFSRNFGSHAAVNAGLKYCTGDVATIISCDLQEPPSLISDFITEWKKGYQIIWGIRKSRQDASLVIGFLSRLYYQIINFIADVKLPLLGVDSLLLDRKVIDVFNNTEEKNSSFVIRLAWLGFKQIGVEFNRNKRIAGKSKWTFSKRVKLFIDSVISFSYIPLRLMGALGAAAALLGITYGLFILLNSFFGNPTQGWSSIMVVILTLGGLQMIMLGVLGEYLWRTYDETRSRPKYVISENSMG